jgi:hypothetical protein
VKNLAYKVTVDRVVLVAYGTAEPSDEEWTGYLDVIEREGIDGTVQIIVTDGGEPTPAQRRRLNELLAGRTVPVAVVSGSGRVRGTVTALSWFNWKIKAFPPSGLRDAIAYLEIPSARADLIATELGKLQTEVHRGARSNP